MPASECIENEACGLLKRGERKTSMVRWRTGSGLIERMIHEFLMIYKVQCYSVQPQYSSTFFQCLCFISLWTLYSFHGNLYFLVSKSLGFIPVMTLHFLHGVLVSFQCLGVLLFRCNPSMNIFLIISTESLCPIFAEIRKCLTARS